MLQQTFSLIDLKGFYLKFNHLQHSQNAHPDSETKCDEFLSKSTETYSSGFLGLFVLFELCWVETNLKSRDIDSIANFFGINFDYFWSQPKS